ncbi:GNAT family protein [Nonomuraea sp. MCN248]|uniref:GNAT family protein n=1 Tax=Nonomuraea corallina TaxID=2989783 RepID=A0ABT4SMT2_9ACTN|nr:GNAT family protein [Nonomuraea corallina]MDA0638548.1 GNAT family protein [Nonomuraea corallina]
MWLREVVEADIAPLHAIYGDPAATQHMPFAPRTLEQVADMVREARAAAAREPRLLYALAVLDAADQELIGTARLRIDAEQPHCAELRLGLRPDHWGRGMGTDLVRLLLGFGFKQLGLHRIWGARAPSNLPAQLAMLTAGMVEEGVLRHHVATPDGWRDSVIHAAVEDDWPGR